MSRIQICFIDMDGVLANFSKAACARHNVTYPTQAKLEHSWLEDQVGHKGRFWMKIHGYDYWTQLEPFPWAKKLVALVNDHCDEWRILSKPSSDEHCYSGKYTWVKNHLHKTKHLWLCNGTKSLLAGPNRLLIDDYKKNIDEWRAAGGEAYHWEEVTDDYDKLEIEKRFGEIKSLL